MDGEVKGRRGRCQSSPDDIPGLRDQLQYQILKLTTDCREETYFETQFKSDSKTFEMLWIH